MAWVKNAFPAPPVNDSSATKREPVNSSSKDVNMLEEGDAMAGSSRNANANGGSGNVERESNQNLDYDVGDDEWI